MTTIRRSLVKGATLGALVFSLAAGPVLAGHGSSGGSSGGSSIGGFFTKHKKSSGSSGGSSGGFLSKHHTSSGSSGGSSGGSY